MESVKEFDVRVRAVAVATAGAPTAQNELLVIFYLVRRLYQRLGARYFHQLLLTSVIAERRRVLGRWK